MLCAYLVSTYEQIRRATNRDLASQPVGRASCRSGSSAIVMAMATRAFVGLIVHSLGNPDQLDVHENAVLVVKDGKIACLEPEERLPELIEQYQISEANIVKMTKGQFVMPGLVDTHLHAPQYPNVGLGYDKTLLEWLDTYTFPLEASYSDAAFAEKVYQAVVRRTLNAGTTTACYFATIHSYSNDVYTFFFNFFFFFSFFFYY
ncbi:Hypothetical predicted protein [Cloeon dipterum]|uniref:Amidohydrolase-related domain-containing protein n=1 Tax=Cloeon dipterum TaxID=197152 RepID=A0A8S1EE88_9INSE|nr:Hypothetical predicted protein [Cloeon dipterum]